MSEPEGGHKDDDGGQLVWAALSSPWLTVGLLVLLPMWWGLGTQILQGVPESSQLARFEFAVVRTALGFGLDHVFSSWVTAFLGILLALNVGARAVDASSTGVRRPWSAWIPSGSRLPLHVARIGGTDLDGLGRQLGAWVPVRGVDTRGGVLFARRGLWIEGLAIAATGVVCFAVAGGLKGADGALGRVVAQASFEPQAPEPARAAVVVPGAADWVAGGPSIEVACGAADLQRPGAPRACSIRTAGGSVSGEVAVHAPLEWLGMSIGLMHSQRDARSAVVEMGIADPKAGTRARQQMAVGQGYSIGLAARGARTEPVQLDVDTQPGPQGPIVTVAPGSAAPWAYAGPAERPAGDAPLRLSPRGREQVELSFVGQRHRAFWVAGALLLLVGLGLVLGVPHLSITAQALPSGELEVRVASLNRPALAERVARALVAASRAEGMG
jgi:hypothetical protein